MLFTHETIPWQARGLATLRAVCTLAIETGAQCKTNTPTMCQSMHATGTRGFNDRGRLEDVRAVNMLYTASLAFD